MRTSDAAFEAVIPKRITQDERSIGYAVVEAAPSLNPVDAPDPAAEERQRKPRKHALLVYPMLSGTSEVLALFVPAFIALVSQRHPSDSDEWLLLCVDRPGVGDTLPMKQSTGCSPCMARLEASVSDSLAVLSAERVDEVHVLGMCLGHAYAAAMVKRLLSEADTSVAEARGASRAPLLRLPYFLLAPWVSTECEHTLRAARLSYSWLSPSLLSASLSVASSVNSMMMGALLTSVPAARLGETFSKMNYEKAERERYTAEDLDFNAQVFRRMVNVSKAVSKPEMNVAVDPEWQHKVCDRVADLIAAGHDGGSWLSAPGGHLSAACEASAATPDARAAPAAHVRPPWCCIWHGTADTMVPIAASEWLATRYGSGVCLTRIQGGSHAGVLVGGGPSRDAPIYKGILRCVFRGDIDAVCTSGVDMEPVARPLVDGTDASGSS